MLAIHTVLALTYHQSMFASYSLYDARNKFEGMLIQA